MPNPNLDLVFTGQYIPDVDLTDRAIERRTQVCCFDYSSLYPSVMHSKNSILISPAAYTPPTDGKVMQMLSDKLKAYLESRSKQHA